MLRITTGNLVGVAAIAVIAAVYVTACEKKEEPEPRAGASAATNPATPPSCGDGGIRAQRVGRIAINDPVDSLRTCAIVRDTVVPADEGMSARKVFVALGTDTVAAEIVNERVWRIEVVSPGMRTTDSLGVGTPVKRLLELKDARAVTGEGRLFVVTSEHCGMSFQLSPSALATHRGAWDRTALASLPDSTAVTRVLVYACGAGMYQPAPN